jgi:hypothetical protein
MGHRSIAKAPLLMASIQVSPVEFSRSQLSRDLNCQYKTAFVLSHKLREAIEAEQRKAQFTGESEVDGAYFSFRSYPGGTQLVTAPHRSGRA